jgi:hypothetical protein
MRLLEEGRRSLIHLAFHWGNHLEVILLKLSSSFVLHNPQAGKHCLIHHMHSLELAPSADKVSSLNRY